MIPEELRVAYNRHIRSHKWKNMRRDVAKLRGSKCERCTSSYDLELHHKTYERFGYESFSDLELLCSACHKRADRERAMAAIIKSANARYAAAFETYATKKYGEDYYGRLDGDHLIEEFDRWLERKESEF